MGYDAIPEILIGTINREVASRVNMMCGQVISVGNFNGRLSQTAFIKLSVKSNSDSDLVVVKD